MHIVSGLAVLHAARCCMLRRECESVLCYFTAPATLHVKRTGLPHSSCSFGSQPNTAASPSASTPGVGYTRHAHAHADAPHPPMNHHHHHATHARIQSSPAVPSSHDLMHSHPSMTSFNGMLDARHDNERATLSRGQSVQWHRGKCTFQPGRNVSRSYEREL